MVQALTKYEKETIINFNNKELTATVFTFNQTLKKRLKRMCLDFPDKVKLEEQDEIFGSVTYTLPKQCISVQQPYSDRMRNIARECSKNNNSIPPLHIKE